MGKEMVFLNDFEYDEDAKKWMPWQYFKNCLEGASVTVGIPKNRGGNQEFQSDAPVFLTAPQEIALYCGRKRDDYETEQMASRVFRYLYLKHRIPEDERRNALPCAHCGARLYLERLWPRVLAPPPAPVPLAHGASSTGSGVGWGVL